ncbi:hypothetical protein lerEdw1_006403 [Lerista edwardsae]|nr:hypothetical protein lerEdw1_006403 [Lerista edwardsae]
MRISTSRDEAPLEEGGCIITSCYSESRAVPLSRETLRCVPLRLRDPASPGRHGDFCACATFTAGLWGGHVAGGGAGMQGAGWRRHVRAELLRRGRGLRALLERRERRPEHEQSASGGSRSVQSLPRTAQSTSLRAPPQRVAGRWAGRGGGALEARASPAAASLVLPSSSLPDEKLQDRLEAQQALLVEKLLPPGAALGPPLEQASLWVQLDMEVKELWREREEQLRQQIVLVTDRLGETEAENREQRSRLGRLAQEVAALERHSEELQGQAWLAAQEAEELRGELERARGLLQDARHTRRVLELRWVREKALEAERLNVANEQEEKYRQKVVRLREKLARLREAAGR